ncbi:MAG TPA: hypothetical protein VGF55_13995 [Gemmataceae bacterium]
MIQPPHRSVTRFFIPLIDVLTLLFCIFLLMPYVAPAEDSPSAGATPVSRDAEALRSGAGDAADLRRELERAEFDRARLQDRLDSVLKRLSVRVLEIDKDTGKLYYYDPDRVEVAGDADAQQLIDRDRRSAGGRELYFLFLFPREVSGYPLQRQVDNYRRWFQGVPHGFDNPRGRR